MRLKTLIRDGKIIRSNKMKKTATVALLIAVVLVSSLCLAACSRNVLKREYVMEMTNELKANIIDDNYRTFYEIFVGGFSDSNGDGTGDLRGVINRLDYLNDGDPNSGKSLGITGIWLMPVMFSVSYHKYDVVDYKTIDPDYGTMEDMRELVDECHKRGINVIIDLVLNHTSNQHKWFKEARKARQNGDTDSPYYDYYSVKIGKSGGGWYDFATDPQGNHWVYEGNFSSDMPELNYDNPAVKDEVEQIAKFWLTDVGIDGFRLDAVKYFYYGDDARNVELLGWFNGMCKTYKQDVYIVGENWSNEVSVLNYYQSVNCFDFAFSELGGYVVSSTKYGAAGIFTSSVESYYNSTKAANPEAIMAPFLSNHDMDRSAGYLKAEDKSLQLASSMYLLMPGNPFIYYGEEIGMKGNRGTASTDANRRLAMLWGDKRDLVKDPVGATYKAEDQTNGTVKKQVKDKNSIYNHYKYLIALRNANPEIARGKVTAINTFGETTAVLKYEYNGSVVYVMHNLSSGEISLDVSALNVRSLRGAATANSTLIGNQLKIGAFGSVVLK